MWHPQISRFVSTFLFLNILAPEILTNSQSHEGYSSKVDVWSLGATLYFMMCGSAPFEDRKGGYSIFDQIKEGRVTFSETVWKHSSELGFTFHL